MQQAQERPPGQPAIAKGPGAGPEPPEPPKEHTSWTPQPKVATGVPVGIPLAIVLSWLAGLAGLDMPLKVALALAGLIVGVVGYLTPER